MYTSADGAVLSPAGGQQRSRFVHDALRAAILHGKLAPGTALRETALAEQFQVSRTPVREAIRRLEAEGLVRAEPRRGAVVSELALDELDEIYDIRSALETLAATRAVTRISERELAEARSRLDMARRAAEAGDLEAVVQANDEFHRVVYRASHSPRLWSLIEVLTDTIRRYRRASLSTPGRASRAIEEHAELLDAIARGETDAISRLMTEHLEHARAAALRAQLDAARAERTRSGAA